jgi:O-antigen/teichoic acid export membrane protein
MNKPVQNESTKALFRDSFMVLFGTAGSMAALFGAQIIVGRFMTLTEFAVLSLSISIAMIIADLLDFGLKTTIVRDVADMAKNNPEQSADYVATIFSLKLRITIVSPFFFPILAYMLSISIFDESPFFNALIISSAAIMAGLFLSLSWFIRSYFQAMKKFALYASYSLIGNSIFLIFTLVFIILAFGTFVLPIFLAISYAIWMCVGVIIYFKIRVKGKATKGFHKTIFSFSKWIMISTVLVTIYNRVDQLIIASLLSYDFVAIYGAVILIASLIPIITTSLSTVLYPRISEIREKSKMKYFIKRNIAITTSIALLLLIPVLIFPIPVSLFFGSAYIESDYLFPLVGGVYLIGLALVPLSLLPLSLGRPEILALLNFLQFAITLVALPLLVIEFGLMGAVYNIILVRILTPFYLISVLLLYTKGWLEPRRNNDYERELY